MAEDVDEDQDINKDELPSIIVRSLMRQGGGQGGHREQWMIIVVRHVDVDLGSLQPGEEAKGKAKLVIVLGDREWREQLYLGEVCDYLRDK